MAADQFGQRGEFGGEGGAAILSSLYDVENILFRLGWNPSPGQWRLTFLPNVLLPALVLLFAGAGAFAVQRPHRILR